MALRALAYPGVAYKSDCPHGSSFQPCCFSGRDEKARGGHGLFRGLTRTATADEEAVAARGMGTRGRQWGLAS